MVGIIKKVISSVSDERAKRVWQWTVAASGDILFILKTPYLVFGDI